VFVLGFTVWAMATPKPCEPEKLPAGLVIAVFVLNLVYLVWNRPAGGLNRNAA
jgi:hypothetical protein